MLLKSGRIYLRHLKMSDTPSVFMAVNESRHELDRFMPWSPHTRSAKDTAEYIKSTHRGHKDKTMLGLGIFNLQTRGYLGGIGLQNLQQINGAAEIGYWVRTSATGNGIATEAAAMLTMAAFEKLKRNKVVLRTATDNPGSNRIAKKLGFTLEGVQRQEARLKRGWLDFACYCMLKKEYGKGKKNLKILVHGKLSLT